MGLFPSDDPGYAATYAEESAMVDAAELIAEALEASGISRAELARRLNVSRSEITSRLIGERNITVRTLATTLHALGSTLELSAARPEPARLERRLSERWQALPLHEDHEATSATTRTPSDWALPVGVR